MKLAPAMASPAQPPRTNPMLMASSVEVGPGTRFAAPSMSRNCWCVTHCRLRTTSSSIIATCAAGPPKLIAPSRRKNVASSLSLWERETGRSSALVSVGRPTLASPVLRRFRLVARGAPGKDQEQKAHEHGEIGSRVTDHEPESLSGSRQFGDFRRSDSSTDDDQQWNRGQPCKQSEEHQEPTTNLECAHEASRQGRVREADSREPVHAHVGIDKFEDTLRE